MKFEKRFGLPGHDPLKPYISRLVSDPRQAALLQEGNKSDRIDARKLAEMLRTHQPKSVYHGGHGVRTLKELGRRYRRITKDMGPGDESDQSAILQLGDSVQRQCRLRSATSC